MHHRRFLVFLPHFIIMFLHAINLMRFEQLGVVASDLTEEEETLA